MQPNPLMTEELLRLLDRVALKEEFVQRAEEFYAERHHEWPSGACAIFKDLLEAKQDLIQYEWSQIKKLGAKIALDQDPEQLDI